VFGQAPANHASSSLPQHGFARAIRWEFLNKSTSETTSTKDNADSSVKLDFGLYSSGLPDNLRKAWPFDFGLVYSVTLSPNNLQTVVNVRNEGKEAFDFQALLHTYLKVKVGTRCHILK
jgi:glucose-6-phosphate 1-epimerase